MAVAVFGSLISFLISGAFDYPLEAPRLATLFYLVCLMGVAGVPCAAADTAGGRAMTWIDMPPRPSRRRALVFIAAFLVAATASLTYTFMRPAEYRVEARLQISPASAARSSSTPKARPNPSPTRTAHRRS